MRRAFAAVFVALVLPSAAGAQPGVGVKAKTGKGVASVAPFTGSDRPGQPGDPVVAGGLVRLDATLAEAPDSDRALDTVKDN